MPPHEGQPIVTAGPELGRGRAVVVAVHGRGAAPANILDLVPRIGLDDLTWIAPAAAGRTWYPFSFMAEREKNEPGLSSALHVLRTIVADIVGKGIAHERIAMLGFSQGACLTSEFAYRNPARYGAVLAFTGGLIGAEGTTWDGASGSFDGAPVFLGCSDVDAHVPRTRVDETAETFRRMGARVTERIYPGMAHIVNEDEIAFARELLRAL
jgi:predicted esterase